MRSLWTVTYVGPHTATTLKKLQRVLSFAALEEERERYVWDGERLERLSFFVDHGSSEWTSVVVSLLQATSKIAWAWQMTGDVKNEIRVEVTSDRTVSEFHGGSPSGLREISWVLRRNEEYSDKLLIQGSKVEHW